MKATVSVSTDRRPRLVVGAQMLTDGGRPWPPPFADKENGPSADDVDIPPVFDATAVALRHGTLLSQDWECSVPTEVVALRYYFRLPGERRES